MSAGNLSSLPDAFPSHNGAGGGVPPAEERNGPAAFLSLDFNRQPPPPDRLSAFLDSCGPLRICPTLFSSRLGLFPPLAQMSTSRFGATALANARVWHHVSLENRTLGPSPFYTWLSSTLAHAFWPRGLQVRSPPG